MKKYIFAALFSAAVILNCALASAEEERYVVVLKEAPAITFFDESDGVINHVDNIFVVDSAKAAYSLAPAGNVEAIFPDEVAYLMEYEDTEDNAEFLADAPVIKPFPEGADDPYFADQWFLPYIGVSASWSRGFDGSGVRIGIVDSGIDLFHPDLPLPLHSYNAMSGADTSNVQDELGHGTAVTGLIAAKTNNGIYTSGIAYGADIVSVKVATKSTMNTGDMLLGFKKALEYDCDVINMSLGFTQESAPYTTAVMRNIVNEAIADGVIIVAAAGNTGDNEETGDDYQYPASYDNVVSVGSVGDYSNHTDVDMEFTQLKIPSRDSNGTYSYSTILSDAPSLFTQHNDQVTCAAPGYKVMTTGVNYTTALKNGTSFSSPIVAAAAAIAKQINPAITASGFIEALKHSCDDVFTSGYDIYSGYGMLNMEQLILYVEDNTPDFTPTPAPTQTPQPTASSEPADTTPSPTEAPECSITKSGNNYTIQVTYNELNTNARIFAAIYEGEKLTAVKSTAVLSGSNKTKIYFNHSGEIDYAQVFIWAFDENSRLSMLPLADSFVIDRTS